MSAPTPSAATQSPPPRLNVECRVTERQPCDLQTFCQPVAAREDHDVKWPAVVRDVSTRGVGLVLGRRFERGTALAIEIPKIGAYPGDTLLAKVIHATPLGGGTWLLGCRFVSDLSDDGLMGLMRLARAQQTRLAVNGPAAVAERPTILAAQKPTSLISGITLEGTTAKGRVGRVPVRRLYLAGSWPVPAGTVLRVRVANQGGQHPPVRIRVTRCTLEGDRWTVTYTFADPPSPEMMHLLGHLVSGEWQLPRTSPRAKPSRADSSPILQP
jgi:hypothetical protein